MAVHPINPNDAIRLERAILEHMGIALDHVEAGTLTATDDGDDDVTITWTARATMPYAEFMAMFNAIKPRVDG